MAGERAFGYYRDPVSLIAIGAYAINRWLVPLAWKGAFLRGHFADIFLVPAALPIWLWIERQIGLRQHDGAPRWSEIAVISLVWAVAAELIAPLLFAHATGDPWDCVAYASGAALAGMWWRAV